MTDYLLTIDPGATYAAWALWRDGVLEKAEQTSASKTLGGVVRKAIEGVAVGPRGFSVLIELPQHYTEDREERAADLFRVAATAGALAYAFEAWGANVTFVRPPEWKGQVPKAAHHARALQVLRADERVRVYCSAKDRHNVWDAVAMGLWALKRIR